jgi:hypothetical protein
MFYLFGFAFMQNEFVILALLQPKTQGYAAGRNPNLSIRAVLRLSTPVTAQKTGALL